jgi:hypothetical protein
MEIAPPYALLEVCYYQVVAISNEVQNSTEADIWICIAYRDIAHWAFLLVI